MKKKENRGITLIALVITIIVLLILAGVSIATLTGQNGILTQANNAKTQTTQSKAEELVTLAIGTLQSENLGDTSKIIPEEIANQINEDNNRTDVVAEGTSFPTNINFVNDGVKVKVDINLTVGEADKMYSVDIDESEIAPQGLFNIETSDGKTASTNEDNLQLKTAKITGIKTEYCNFKNNYDSNDTYYSINHPQITDTLIIPYQVEVEGEIYQVTEVSLVMKTGSQDNQAKSLPDVENIIFPNTVKKIDGAKGWFQSTAKVESLVKVKNVVLPFYLEEIPDYLFLGCTNLEKIEIPPHVKTIGWKAFDGCTSLEEITIPESVETITNTALGYGELKNGIKIINIEGKTEGEITGEPWGATGATINWLGEQ